jgi:hypothetical protein
MQTEQFDAVVIGGGIFGCYAALFLAGKGARVALLEKEAQLFQKASLVNQARLHGGYHYPRSIATAALSDEHKNRFTRDHQQFVHSNFEKYYAIDRFGSFTDPGQFERFCQYLKIPCKRVPEHPLFNFQRLEALYRTEEFSFDPVLLRKFYVQKVETHAGITLLKSVQISKVSKSNTHWTLELQTSAGLAGIAQQKPHATLQTPTVINATYAATNAINRLFGLRDLDLTHEISEIAFITSEQFQNKGLTVMDGPFGSIMPFGLSGFLSLSSVAYTHHKISYENLPHFDCQTLEDLSCRPDAPGVCTNCPRRPKSNAYKMLRQMQQYFTDVVRFEHWFSYFTIKSKLKTSYIDDGRPTDISVLSENPRLICLFAGKVNSIYEIEKIV